jgi:aldehyde dehydrogenase (NAD+)
MGGKNAVIVMDDANLVLAANAIAWSAFGTTGQRCTACSRVIVHEAAHDELLRLVTRVRRRSSSATGSTRRRKSDRGEREAAERVASYVEIGATEGARRVTGGERATEGALARGFFFRPTVLANVRPDMRVAQEEIFGPVLSVLKVASLRKPSG